MSSHISINIIPQGTTIGCQKDENTMAKPEFPMNEIEKYIKTEPITIRIEKTMYIAWWQKQKMRNRRKEKN